MKVGKVAAVALLAVCVVAPVNAQRSLDRAEVLEVIEKLTSTGRQTWIPAGTIEAKHQQYRAARTTDASSITERIEQEIREDQSRTDTSERTLELQKMYLDAIPFNVRYELSNESSMTSSVVLRYDGTRFYWEVAISSRSDSVTPSADLAGNAMVNYFNRSWNDRRVFAWDGQKYTIYAVSAGGAIVDTSDRLPRAVTGPLTAGVIPWGRGLLSYANLVAAKVSATEIVRDGTTQIELTVEPAGGSEMTFLLDPSKDLAAAAHTLPGGNNTLTSTYCSGYRRIGGYWVPTTVVIEQYDAFTNRLLCSDKWDYTAVDAAVPGAERFSVSFGADTSVEYYSTMSARALVYHHSNAVDADLLLAERLAYVAEQGKRPQNCATASLQYAATQLGRVAPATRLTQMVGSDGRTTMYDLKRGAQSLGLHCRVVQTDLATLEALSGCQAILHLPGQEHFVVLDRVDDRYAWIVDLADDRFYCRKDRGFMATDWSDGVALLLSNEPIEGPFADVPEGVLRRIAGGDGWSCTLLLQDEWIIPCTNTPDGWGCFGYFQWYFERWGCEPAPDGTCTTGLYARMAGTDCYYDRSS
jgi:hypothetical protein